MQLKLTYIIVNEIGYEKEYSGDSPELSHCKTPEAALDAVKAMHPDLTSIQLIFVRDSNESST